MTDFTCIDPNKQRLHEPEPSAAHYLQQRSFDDSVCITRPKVRSGLATLAGFAGLALIFSRFSLAPLIWAQFPGVFDVSRPDEAALATLFLVLIPLPGLIAPLPLWLGVKAWTDLKHHPDKSGKIQAGFALIIGLVGTLILLSEIYQVTKALMVPI